MEEQLTFNDLDQDTKNLIFDDINKTLTEDLFSPIKQIYIDWTYLQDIYLGALVTLCKSQEDYSYILQEIPNYNDRIVRGHASYFPKLGYTDNDLETYINTNDNSLLILGSSPMTNIFSNIKELIDNIQLRNYKLEYRERLRLIVNLYPIKLREEVTRLLLYMISQVYKNIEITIVSQPIHTISIATLLECDMIFIERSDLFFKKNSITANTFFDSEKFPFAKIAVVAPKVIDNEQIVLDLDTKTDQEIAYMFNTTVHICGIMSKFYLINPIILVDNPEQQK